MIIRVFPRKTNATPEDDMSFVACPPPFYAQATEVHISVTFTWDINYAEWLAEQWKHVAPVKIGGPAYGLPSGNFVSGLYLKRGYTITSRGCPNRCWFCSVHKREPELLELPIVDGWNVLDDNLLACSEHHIKAVFSMLKKQSERAQFTGGLEAKILKGWHAELLADLRPRQMFFAYDTPDDLEPLVCAAKLLKEYMFTRQHLRCYVLIGYPKDTFVDAEKRLQNVVRIGMFPMAMLWKDQTGKVDVEWQKLQRAWARPAIIYNTIKKGEGI